MKYVKKKIKNLRKKLRYWEYLYYIKNFSEVSNEKYDLTLEELRQLELAYPCFLSKNSPTQSIGSFYHYNVGKIRHKVPMLSLNSIISKSQFLLFDKRMQIKWNKKFSIPYCCELKMDGIAISLLYKRGKLISASTRGDGMIGENVTSNILTINSIPSYLNIKDSYDNKLPLPYLLEIRGEVFISKLCFEQLNQIAIKEGKRPFSNARNIASGSLRQSNAQITAIRSLSFYCYGISYYCDDVMLPDSHWDRLQLCKKWGVPVNNYNRLISGVDQVLEYYYLIQKIRSDLELDVDGIVVKVDSCEYQNKLGYGYKEPNWAIAYKFPTEVGFTKVREIFFQVGRTGIITPVASLDPVLISNVNIKRVNLHNINEIKRLGLMIGDTVRIQRSGDVIPKILDVVISQRINRDLQFVELPCFCPVCESDLNTWNKQSVTLRCSAGLLCPAQRKAILKHFVSRKAMNIRGMGNKVIDQLVDQNSVHTPADFFYLDQHKLLCINGYGIKSSNRLLRSIDNAKRTTLARFIYALGIYSVGEVIANNLALSYKTLDCLVVADLDSLLNLKCVGPVVAKNIYYFFRNPDNLKNIQNLLDPSIGIICDIII